MPLIPRAWPIAAALAAIMVSGVVGYQMGGNVCEGRHARALAEAQREAVERAEDAARAERRRLEEEASRLALQLELEDAANADPVSRPDCLPVERVLRLRDR